MHPFSKLSIGRTVITSICAVLFALAALPGLFASPAGEQHAGDRLLVVATTNIVGDIVGRVGGELISLSVLMPPGADPHSFQPTPRDAHLLADAAVLFVNGAGLEQEFLGDLINSAEPRRVVELSAHLPLIRLADAHMGHDDHDEHDHDEDEEHDDHEGHDHDEDEEHDDHEGHDHDEDEEHDDHEGHDHDEDEEHDDHDEHDHDEDEEHDDHEGHDHDEDEEHDDHDEHDHDEDEMHDDHDDHAGHDHGEFDPHVWFDPTLVAGWAVEIAEVLTELDPAHEAEYTAQASALIAELDELDAWIKAQVELLPHNRRIIVTDHDVMAYFAQRYGFELLDSVVPNVSTVAEPSARHLAQLSELIAKHEVPAIFVGTTVNPQVAEAIAGDLGIVVVPFFTGSLSEAGGPADTYERFMRTNVERIVEALGS